jgi:hypothetical protein
MSAAFAPTASTPTPTGAAPSPFPSPAALRLERASWGELERAFQRGTMPDLEGLVDWEFRGINRLPLNSVPVAGLLGIKKFVKGFFRAPTADGAGTRIMGYNRPVARNRLDGRWTIAAKRFGYYEVYPVDPTARDNHALHALLLDYGRGGNRAVDPTAGLRDYLVQVDPTNPDLLLGKAYYAVGAARLRLNYFILERHRRAP